jgi:hypothetical protein
MKIFLRIIAIIVLVILQIGLMPCFKVGNFVPNIIIITALILMLIDLDKEALLVGSVSSLIIDFMSPFFFGLFSLITVLLVFIWRFLIHKYFANINVWNIGLIILLSALLLNFALGFLSKNLDFYSIIMSALVSAIVAILAYLILQKTYQEGFSIKI